MRRYDSPLITKETERLCWSLGVIIDVIKWERKRYRKFENIAKVKHKKLWTIIGSEARGILNKTRVSVI
jgi:hypothetical protein